MSFPPHDDRLHRYRPVHAGKQLSPGRTFIFLKTKMIPGDTKNGGRWGCVSRNVIKEAVKGSVCQKGGTRRNGYLE